MGVWEEYLQGKLITIDLSEIGLDGYWVKARTSASMSPGRFKRLLDQIDQNDPLGQQKVSMQEWVVDWNLPDEDGKPLPIPRKSDAWLDIVPIGVVTFIMQKINERDRGALEGNPPKTSESSPPSEGTEKAQTG